MKNLFLMSCVALISILPINPATASKAGVSINPTISMDPSKSKKYFSSKHLKSLRNPAKGGSKRDHAASCAETTKRYEEKVTSQDQEFRRLVQHLATIERPYPGENNYPGRARCSIKDHEKTLHYIYWEMSLDLLFPHLKQKIADR